MRQISCASPLGDELIVTCLVLRVCLLWKPEHIQVIEADGAGYSERTQIDDFRARARKLEVCLPFPFSACWPHDFPGRLAAFVCYDVRHRQRLFSNMQCTTVVAQLAGVHLPPSVGRSGPFCATSCERARCTASWVCVFQADVIIRSSFTVCL